MSTVDKTLLDTFYTKFETLDHVRDWCYTYLDIDLPSGHIDPDSNSSPTEWIFEAYTNYRLNKGAETPGYIVLSSRESYKTFSESVFAVIMMAHFGCSIAHMAAIEPQAKKAIEYINTFLKKIEPYLIASGRSLSAQNSRTTAILDQTGHQAYVSVIIATMTGANSSHTNIMSIDEIDVMRFPKAYEEAKLIPGVFDGQFPLTIKTSTRKFAFGLMEKEIQNAPAAKEKVLRWNILDVTEKCQPERHRPDLPKETRYIPDRSLPLQNLSEADYNMLPEEQKGKYLGIEAYKGCGSCPLLAVCQMRLAHRPERDVKGFYKPIDFVINQFSKISPDMAEAQLMCWKPSLSGLIYPRFDEAGNTLSLAQAWERFTGAPAPHGNLSVLDLVEEMKNKEIKFYSSIDWGHAHKFVILVSAKIGKEWWIIDCFAQSGLEFEQIMSLGETVNNRYRLFLSYPDPSQPMMIKAYKRRNIRMKAFKPDVKGGIEAVRGQIVDALGIRRLKVVLHERTQEVIEMFRKHHFNIDPSGNLTTEPDDEEYSDIGDTVRYKAQNLFGLGVTKREPVLPSATSIFATNKTGPTMNDLNPDWLMGKIKELTNSEEENTGRSGSLLWDFGEGTEDES